MDIHLHGEYTEQDIQRSMAMMRGRTFRVLWIIVGFWLVLAAISVLMSALSGRAEPIDLISGLLPIVLVPALLALAIWWALRSQVRKLRDAPLFRGTVSGRVTDDVLELRSEQSEGKTKWGAFIQYKMSDDVVLLYQNNAAAQILPRSLFASDADWHEFQQFIQATVPEKTRRQPSSGRVPR